MTQVTLYTKEGCHLCEEAKEVIEQVRREHSFLFDIVTIREGDGLFEQYHALVPVVAINGRPVFTYRVTERQLREGLGRSLRSDS